MNEILKREHVQSAGTLRTVFNKVWNECIPKIREVEEDNENTLAIAQVKKDTTKTLQELDKAYQAHIKGGAAHDDIWRCMLMGMEPLDKLIHASHNIKILIKKKENPSMEIADFRMEAITRR